MLENLLASNANERLLNTCQRMKLEGIVFKRKESAYRPGPTMDWRTIKPGLGSQKTKRGGRFFSARFPRPEPGRTNCRILCISIRQIGRHVQSRRLTPG